MPLYTAPSPFVAPGTPGPGVSTAGNLGSASLSGLLYESNTDNLTASATQTQAAATPLTAELNRITTVAAAGNGVMLPPSYSGLTVLVVNHGANPMQVYGAGSDTVDDVAASVGVSQMQGSVCIYSCYTTGAWYTEGLATGYAGSFQTLSARDGITANPGGGQASAVALTAMLNRISVCATGGDSVKLPASAPGQNITVTNAGAASLNIFPLGTDQINALGASAAFALAATKTAEFICHTTGQWHSLLSA